MNRIAEEHGRYEGAHNQACGDELAFTFANHPKWFGPERSSIAVQGYVRSGGTADVRKRGPSMSDSGPKPNSAAGVDLDC